MLMPDCRALAGNWLRNSLADFAAGLNGLYFVTTSFIYFVIILASGAMFCALERETELLGVSIRIVQDMREALNFFARDSD